MKIQFDEFFLKKLRLHLKICQMEAGLFSLLQVCKDNFVKCMNLFRLKVKWMIGGEFY